MRIRPSRRTLVALGATLALAAVACVGLDRWVRARVALEAERRHLVVEIGAVRPTWSGVRLVGAHVRLRGVDGVDARFDEVRVDAASDLRVRAVLVRGGAIDLSGDDERLAASLRAWQSDLPRPTGEHAQGAAMSLEGVAVRWPARGLDASGVGVRRTDGGLAIDVGRAAVTFASIDVRAEDAHVMVDRSLRLRSARASRVDVAYDPNALPPSALDAPAAQADAQPSASAPRPRPEIAVLAALRARARAAASLVAAKLPSGADVAIDALAISPRGDGLALGPGALAISRDDARVVASFRTRPGAGGTPLSVRVDLPLADGDVRVSLDGGPVSLALLGLRDGTAGLGDLDRAAIEGKAELVLAPAGDSLAFDVDLRARDLALTQRRLAKETIRGLHVGARARGTISDAGVVRIDDADVSMDRAHVVVRGTVDVSTARAGASLAIEVPRTDCQALLDSAPATLLPTVQGLRMEGTLAARARVAFQLRRVDDLSLDYDVDATCKVTDVPPHLARDRFRRPFTHRFYSPRGEAREALIGPGTPRWTPLGAMSRFLPAAVVMTEDGGVFRRDGFNRAQIKYAVVTDLKERRFARGASTLTMQLAKNVFLSRDKVLARKLEEIVLTVYLSQRFSKEDILELYLNVVEFGPDVYGVRDAAAHYFGKGPANVTLSEALFLASMLPSPVRLHALKSPRGVPEAYTASFHHLMDLARQSGLITETDLEAGKAETLVFR